MFDTYRWFYAREALSEHAHSKMMPDILAMAAEFRKTPIRPDHDNDNLNKLQGALKRGDVFKAPRYQKFAPKPSQYIKTTLLLHAHLYRRYLDIALTSLHNDDLQVRVLYIIYFTCYLSK